MSVKPVRKPAASPIERLGGWLSAHAGIDYLVLRIVVFSLVAIGLVMVVSTSMTWSVIEGSSVWGDSVRQGAMVVAGLVLFWLALKLPPHFVRRFAWLLLVVAFVLLVAVLIPGVGTGREEVGSQSWIAFGPVRFQPSEVAKFAIAIFGAHFLAEEDGAEAWWRSRFTIFAEISVALFLLIIAEGDFGMALSFAAVVGFVLIFGGVAVGWIFAAIGAGMAGLAFVFFSGGFRTNRFHVFFDALFGRFEDTKGTAFQSYQGFLSLADGSVAGVGLGQSRAKWFYLPEARNDFIFAVIGEELGLWGGAMVIVLFGLLGVFGLRAAARAANRYQRLLAATLTAAIVSQAFYNMGYVVGLLPVTGIQLPLISAGGTSAIITLASLGLLANVARHEPEAVSAFQSYGRPSFDVALKIAEPANEEARPKVVVRGGDARRERFGAPVTERRERGSYRADYHERTTGRDRWTPPRPHATHEVSPRRRNSR